LAAPPKRNKTGSRVVDGSVVEYLTRLPAAVPAGRALVHNHVRPTRRLGLRGFRAWLVDDDDPKIEPCGCGWAPELGQHFRVRAPGEAAGDASGSPHKRVGFTRRAAAIQAAE
jgi:hypothetical protein